ncbi:MAG: radical SAM protein [Polyangiaceae bacterium]|nr:radical SAM protein [Polyangiaceae bacterium]
MKDAGRPQGTGERARALFAASAPRVRSIHLFRSSGRRHLLAVNGSRIFDIDAEVFDALDRASAEGDEAAVDRLLADFGVTAPAFIDDRPLDAPGVHALSLAVAQKCNLGCTYCYAQEGTFGGPSQSMPIETARASVDLLLRDAKPGDRFNLAFLGGEPLANRGVLRAATEYAARVAEERGAALTFSITTNGTLLTPEDGDFFEEHGFAVTISLDGVREAHNLLRPYKSGKGTFDTIIERARPLLEKQRRMQVSARATVTPRNLSLKAALDELIGLGFHSVGFSPMLRSPTGREEVEPRHLEAVLEAMVECGMEAERRVAAGERYPFANLINALRELHRGTHRPYPCGAGAGYFGVSAEGELSACHRFVGDSAGAMGDIRGGVDPAKQAAWLGDRHVLRQEPCHQCWARFLCGGGCHHEALGRGRTACDYIRGWLHYCLGAYSRLSRVRPDYFQGE